MRLSDLYRLLPGHKPRWTVPVIRWGRRRQPYTGEQLREIRRRNGVGRPPLVNRMRAAYGLQGVMKVLTDVE